MADSQSKDTEKEAAAESTPETKQEVSGSRSSKATSSAKKAETATKGSSSTKTKTEADVIRHVFKGLPKPYMDTLVTALLGADESGSLISLPAADGGQMIQSAFLSWATDVAASYREGEAALTKAVDRKLRRMVKERDLNVEHLYHSPRALPTLAALLREAVGNKDIFTLHSEAAKLR